MKMCRATTTVFWALLVIFNGDVWSAKFDNGTDHKHTDKAVEIISCDDVMSTTESYFINPNYPSFDNEVGTCMVTVNRASTDICQLRLEFIGLELTEPDVDGQCFIDFLLVDGSTSTVPTICGINNGQHMYLDFAANGGPIRLIIDRTEISTPFRYWNIKIQQIPCTSRAPKGCLQYYKETTGLVQSFNFQNFITNGTPQLANTNYAVCIENHDGYCGIEWVRNLTVGRNGFTISGNKMLLNPDLIGDPVVCGTGTECPNDYVIIPGGTDENGDEADRYCGLGFPQRVLSTMKPFIMFVTTDDNEFPDAHEGIGTNSGFSLLYRQITTC